ncbi:MAG: CoA transferase [Acidobacteria bacterium]|nr:CoA transferase [Acidobacteriota bacterium]
MAALDGLRVLDLTQFEAGPACTQALAWLGADVVKVEKPGRGDRARGADSARNEAYAPLFCAWNANKRSLAIDIGSDPGRALFLRLVPRFDVLVESFGPGVMERLDIDPEALRPVAPGLIYARIKGFGSSGPYAGFAVQQPIAQAAAGALSINGEPDGPPTIPGSMGDAGAGMVAAVAVLAAWAQKLRTGRGQLIDLSMQEAMTFFVRGRGALGSRWGARAAPRTGNAGDVPPGDLYPCKPFGPNDYVYLMPMTERHWASLCRAIGRPELRTDLRFYSVPWRIQNHRALHAEISSWTKERTKFEAMDALGAAGVPCSACLDTAELLRDRHLAERGFIEEMDLPVHGRVSVPGFAPRLSGSRVPVERPPRLGEHTDEVLRAELALDDSQLDALRDAGVIGGQPRCE